MSFNPLSSSLKDNVGPDIVTTHEAPRLASIGCSKTVQIISIAARLPEYMGRGHGGRSGVRLYHLKMDCGASGIGGVLTCLAWSQGAGKMGPRVPVAPRPGDILGLYKTPAHP